MSLLSFIWTLFFWLLVFELLLVAPIHSALMQYWTDIVDIVKAIIYKAHETLHGKSYQTLRILMDFTGRENTDSLLCYSKKEEGSRDDALVTVTDWLVLILHGWFDSGALVLQAKSMKHKKRTLQLINPLIFTNPLYSQRFLSHELRQCQLLLLPGASWSILPPPFSCEKWARTVATQELLLAEAIPPGFHLGAAEGSTQRSASWECD